ncbi:glycoside hydrolase family 71/99 protein [Falsiroseomonas selenitidurans]|uniref:Uncharacterized protein n=1 Tax=Falsiroseomonas selenitidurans TaxID=2716335 RepID=A0ABX1E8K2_9PROT|nr:hypothetical protein [Falsiroseomonas selenitidurans]NKC31837.1 hypothetical protein [Falsiroseomonas selenitidurans]
MPRLTRRALLAGLAAAFASPAKAARSPPALGAIRWDAWYAPGSIPTEAMVRSLSPPEFRHRAPFFAEVPPGAAPLRFPAASQAAMDREIALASGAGLDFWAFVTYPPGSGLTEAFRLYRASTLRPRPRFCLITEARRLRPEGGPLHEHPPLLADPDYQGTADGRPIYLIGFLSEALIAGWGGIAPLRAALDAFRRRVRTAGAANPCLVLMTPDIGQARRWAPTLGFDALSAYAWQDGARQAPYAALARLAERGWSRQAALGMPVIPTAMSGWDRRPRVANPVPWEDLQRPGLGADRHYAAPRPAELTAHLRRAVAFAATQPLRLALAYAWNEHDEGGWLQPTQPDDRSRLRALRAALCRPQPAEACLRLPAPGP